jgi:hypothetical protein
MTTVCFSHGQESGPWGTKIRALADVAHAVESLDYQGMADPQARARKLSARVVLVPDGHRLVADLAGLCRVFRLFLDEAVDQAN